jgi:hypothetical protein
MFRSVVARPTKAEVARKKERCDVMVRTESIKNKLIFI